MNRFSATIANLVNLRARWSAIVRAWRDPRTPWAARVLLIAAGVYVVLPFDLVPDLIPIMGWIDDLAIVPIALLLFERWAKRRSADAKVTPSPGATSS